MFKSLLLTTGVCCGLFLLIQPGGAEAGDLIIHADSTMTINTGHTLDMNCNDIFVESDGELIHEGFVDDRGDLTVEEHATYTVNGGTLDKCSFTPIGIPGNKIIFVWM